MKYNALILALATTTALGLAIPDDDDSVSTDMQAATLCGQKNRHVNEAIDQFCQKDRNPDGSFPDNIMVPSDYATAGYRANGVHVWIDGQCDPPQWVPLAYCETQFHHMCGFAGDVDGRATQRYGFNNDCQVWHIASDGDGQGVIGP